MKKVIAVLIALAMVLSMSVMAFAGFHELIYSPSECGKEKNGAECTKEDWDKAINLSSLQIEDFANFSKYINIRINIDEMGYVNEESGEYATWEEAWKLYLTYVVMFANEDTSGAVKQIIGIVKDGYVSVGDAISIISEVAKDNPGGDGNTGDISGILSGVFEAIKDMLPKDKEPEVTADQYAEELAELINSGAAFEDITKKIGDDLESGKIVVKQIPDIAKAVSEKVEAGEIENNETVQKILDFFKNFGGEGGSDFPSFGDITLPWDNGNSESGSFLDTIMGIIGSIGDLFNPTPDEPSDPSNPSDPGDTTIPDTGDVSFVAVAAVAAVAGAALVLTRKKSDAE